MKELKIEIKLIRKSNGDITRTLSVPETTDFSYLEIIGAIQASLFTALNAYEKLETPETK